VPVIAWNTANHENPSQKEEPAGFRAVKTALSAFPSYRIQSVIELTAAQSFGFSNAAGVWIVTNLWTRIR